MAAHRRHPENEPLDPELIDEVAERVFKDYEPPTTEQQDSEDESDEEAESLTA